MDSLTTVTRGTLSNGTLTTYDAAGNLKKIVSPGGTTKYKYYGAGQLISFEESGTLSSGTYTYNGFGDRTATTVNGLQTDYWLDTTTSLTNVIAEFAPQSTEDDIYYLYGLDVIGQYQNDTWSYYSTDGLGSLRQMTDARGAISFGQHYDPYGIPLQTAGRGSGFAYTGEQTDANGLVYLRARYYHPGMGMFISRDPVLCAVDDSAITFNAYSYVRGNPIRFTDPSGEFIPLAVLVTIVWGAVIRAASGAIGGAGYAHAVYDAMLSAVSGRRAVHCAGWGDTRKFCVSGSLRKIMFQGSGCG